MTPFAGLPGAVRDALHDEPVPDWRAPTLETLTDKRFCDPEWIFERKFDGMRCLAFRDGERVRLLSRNRQPLNATYPELVDALAAQHATRFVVDGEGVAYQRGPATGTPGHHRPGCGPGVADPRLLLPVRPTAPRRQVDHRRAAGLA